MPPTYKQKSNRGSTAKNVMERAVKEVLLNKKPCRTVATDFGTPYVTLGRYVYKIRCTEKQRGQLITMCCVVSAIGNTVPPMMNLPRVNYKEHFINCGPLGVRALLIYPSGWPMTAENFFVFMKHFLTHVRCPPDNISIPALPYLSVRKMVLHYQQLQQVSVTRIDTFKGL
ncbi:hypothetical protein HOLleu_35254 [Holothuria leucospilota]|uniref:Uncharacterized protein n=1 Tax=Holothuria leucospilota TaxID=206669 RepID=A0A9Q0YMH4_HOLLE|nr:hypothetical protein HOLleu_35254 [Holothuria leucospilota]